jgi:hypothetical protein
MRSISRPNGSAALGAALLIVASSLFAACNGAPEPAGGNTAATNAEAPTNAAQPKVAPPRNPADALKPPVGMEDTIEGTVVGLACLKNTPNATAEQLKACAEGNLAKGGQLGILSADNVIYVDSHPDARVTNAKIKDFVGQEVTVQGQHLEDMPNLNFGAYTVKKFDMKLARRKGAVPAGATPNMPKPKQSDIQRPAAPPAKKPQ